MYLQFKAYAYLLWGKQKLSWFWSQYHINRKPTFGVNWCFVACVCVCAPNVEVEFSKYRWIELMHQQQLEERLSSGSLAAAYCIGLLTAATIAFDYSHTHWTAIQSAMLDKHYLQLVGIWDDQIYFVLGTKLSSVHYLFWTVWTDLWHLYKQWEWRDHDLFSWCVRKVFDGSSTLGVSHPESLTGKIPTRKVFLQVLWREILIFLYTMEP